MGTPDTAGQVVAAALACAPTLGPARLVCIDGPAGSGKTTLAAAVADHAGAPVVHLDDLYPGWSGLDAAGPQVRTLLEPLARGEPGSYRRFDWDREEYAELVRVPPAPLLVLEGVNSGDRQWARWCTFLVWVETDDATRLRRGLARDGERMRPQWERWMRQEAVILARERTRERADLTMHT